LGRFSSYFGCFEWKVVLLRLARMVILFLIVALLSSCTVPDFSGQPHLSDKQLIENFEFHRAEFEKLVAMILEDKNLTRVDEDWTEPKDFDQERIAEYRKVFQVIGTPRGFSAPVSREQIEFIASAQGWVAHGSSKGYLYGEKCPAHIGKTVESLDEMSLAKRPSGSACRHVEGKWFLYFISD
jgi:hypothetical protein